MEQIKTEGQLAAEAFKAGQPESANPYQRGSESYYAWLDTYRALAPARTATAAEVQEAAQYDASRFRRRANRHYS
jgi:hypothetical protein